MREAREEPRIGSLWPLFAIVTLGTALAVLVAADGTLQWRLLRLALVAGVTTGVTGLWLRSGRAEGWAAILFGTTGLVAGIGVGIRWMTVDGLSWISVSGLIALLSGLALVGAGIGRLTSELRALMRIVVSVAVLTAVAVLVWTLSPAFVASNVPPIAHGDDTPAGIGLYAEEVRFGAADGVELWAWFIPPSDGKTVVLRHGAGATATSVLSQAEVLARHGYGVLITDARGHGLSGGRAMDFGWYGDVDIRAAIDFLVTRPEVDPEAIGVVGMSMGGEEAIGAIGADHRIAAAVAEGATARTDADKIWFTEVYGTRGRLQSGLEWLQYGLTDLLTEASKPDTLAASAHAASPRPVLLIAGGQRPDEIYATEHIRSQAGDGVSIWVVPGAGHVQGLAVAGDDWEREVIGFLDGALVDR